jgi:hypothetical protein
MYKEQPVIIPLILCSSSSSSTSHLLSIQIWDKAGTMIMLHLTWMITGDHPAYLHFAKASASEQC